MKNEECRMQNEEMGIGSWLSGVGESNEVQLSSENLGLIIDISHIGDKKMTLHDEVKRFKEWSDNYPIRQRSGEWEMNYDSWGALYKATQDFLATPNPNVWSQQDIDDLFYTIARDNECEQIVGDLLDRPKLLLHLAELALKSIDKDTRWQLARQLGHLHTVPLEAESLLREYMNDSEEYVRRQALLALANLQSHWTEFYAEQAWESEHEYQRIAALWAFYETKSPKLNHYLQKAIEDGRTYLFKNVEEIKRALVKN